MLICNHLQGSAHRFEQFARAQEEIRIAGPAISLVSGRERLVDKGASVGDRRDDGRQKRTVQVVGDDHSGEAPAFEGPWPFLQIGPKQLQPGRGDGFQRRNVSVHRQDRMAALQEKTGVAAASGRKIEDRAARLDEPGEPDDPLRGIGGAVASRIRFWRLRSHLPFPISKGSHIIA